MILEDLLKDLAVKTATTPLIIHLRGLINFKPVETSFVCVDAVSNAR